VNLIQASLSLGMDFCFSCFHFLFPLPLPRPSWVSGGVWLASVFTFLSFLHHSHQICSYLVERDCLLLLYGSHLAEVEDFSYNSKQPVGPFDRKHPSDLDLSFMVLNCYHGYCFCSV
jgi:hypothetical protein